MLKLSEISKSYGDALILNQISFVLNRGEVAGLIGPNGAGKSTLLKIITGLESADKGQVWLDKTVQLGYLAQALVYSPNATVGSVVSETLGPALQSLTQIEELAQAIASTCGKDYEMAFQSYTEALEEAERLNAYSAPARLAEVLAGLGLAHLNETTPVATLSGGQKTRLGLVRLLLAEPDLLLLDEPTNYLDLEALHWLQEFVKQYAHQQKGAVLVVSHDRAFLDSVVTKILALDDTSHILTQYPGNYSDYVKGLEQHRQKQFDEYRRQQERIGKIEEDIRTMKTRANHQEQATIDFWLLKKAKKGARTAKVRERKLEKLLNSEEKIEKPRQSWQMKLEFGEAPPSGQLVLSLEGVGKRFGDRNLFEGVQAEIRAGERVALVGPNGSGKTTLLRLISGELKPDTGFIRLGANVRVGYFSQEQAGLDQEQTVLEAVRKGAPLSERDARNFLHFFLFSGDAVFKRVSQLSYGERARLVLARLVLSGVNFLLLDEPLNHLDITSRQQFETALANFDGTIVAVAHDRYFVEQFAERVWTFQRGHLQIYYDVEAGLKASFHPAEAN